MGAHPDPLRRAIWHAFAPVDTFDFRVCDFWREECQFVDRYRCILTWMWCGLTGREGGVDLSARGGDVGAQAPVAGAEGGAGGVADSPHAAPNDETTGARHVSIQQHYDRADCPATTGQIVNILVQTFHIMTMRCAITDNCHYSNFDRIVWYSNASMIFIGYCFKQCEDKSVLPLNIISFYFCFYSVYEVVISLF